MHVFHISSSVNILVVLFIIIKSLIVCNIFQGVVVIIGSLPGNNNSHNTFVMMNPTNPTATQCSISNINLVDIQNSNSEMKCFNSLNININVQCRITKIQNSNSEMQFFNRV